MRDIRAGEDNGARFNKVSRVWKRATKYNFRSIDASSFCTHFRRLFFFFFFKAHEQQLSIAFLGVGSLIFLPFFLPVPGFHKSSLMGAQIYQAENRPFVHFMLG